MGFCSWSFNCGMRPKIHKFEVCFLSKASVVLWLVLGMLSVLLCLVLEGLGGQSARPKKATLLRGLGLVTWMRHTMTPQFACGKFGLGSCGRMYNWAILIV
ncbi:hypothetical protein OIU79_018911, partial [Salix purpurea]